MEEKKETKISLSTFFLILAIIAICLMGYYIYKLNTEKNDEIKKVKDLNNQVSTLNEIICVLQGKLDKIENDITEDEKKDNTNNIEGTETSSVSYVVLEVEDTEAYDLQYKEKKITDKQKIKSLMKIIDSATPYQSKVFISSFEDAPPCVNIYMTNGEVLRVIAGDSVPDGGEIVDLITKYYKKDGSDKTLYKVNTQLGEYIQKLFNETE